MKPMSKSRRGIESRHGLIAAAREAIRDHGVGGLRIRDIAARAGMSPAGVLYHYPEFADLTVDVHRAAVDDFFSERAQVLDAMADPSSRLVAAIRSGLPAHPRDETMGLLYELHGVANRSPLHAALMTSLWEREELLFRGLVQSGVDAGVFKPTVAPHLVATALIALEDGLGLHIVSGNTAMSRDRAERLMVSTASELLRCHLPYQAADLGA
jgi:AcrR family transcriptional regulator